MIVVASKGSRGWLFAASLALLAACSSKPLTATTSAAGATAGTAGAGGTAGAAGTAGTGGGGATGEAGVAGADSDGSRCASTNDRASVTVHLADGQFVGCDATSFDAGFGGGIGPMTFEGKIVSTEASTIVFDSGARIEIVAPGLNLTAIPRVSAQVKLAFRFFYACQQSLEIVAVNPTDGSTPLVPAGQLLVAVSDGGAAFPDSPYRVETVPLGCSTARGCGSPAPDNYAFDFSFTEGGAAPVRARARMGEAVTVGSGAGALTARNLRSYQSEACDDYWNFAYTIIWFPTLGLQ